MKQMLVEVQSFAVDSLNTDTRHVTREYSLPAEVDFAYVHSLN